MPENVELIFNSLKDDMHTNFTNLANQIEKLKESIEQYQDKLNMSTSDIRLINQKIVELEKRLIENFEQHKEFYGSFDKLNKFVYKLTGGIVLAGAAVGMLLKLIGMI